MIKPETCKYCHNFYSTLCGKCRVNTGDPTSPDFCCCPDHKVQKNWKDYKKAVKKINDAIKETMQ